MSINSILQKYQFIKNLEKSITNLQSYTTAQFDYLNENFLNELEINSEKMFVAMKLLECFAEVSENEQFAIICQKNAEDIKNYSESLNEIITQVKVLQLSNKDDIAFLNSLKGKSPEELSSLDKTRYNDLLPKNIITQHSYFNSDISKKTTTLNVDFNNSLKTVAVEYSKHKPNISSETISLICDLKKFIRPNNKHDVVLLNTALRIIKNEKNSIDKQSSSKQNSNNGKE